MERLTKPVVGAALIDEWMKANETPKPTALGTPLRYSSAHACARQQAYAALGEPPTEPMDEAGVWVTGLGTAAHDLIQSAVRRRFGGARCEVMSGFRSIGHSGELEGYLSGSCDILIDTYDIGSHYAGTHVLNEIKSMGTYSFDKQVGWDRMRASVRGGEGPALKAITQAGLNALGIEEMDRNVVIETIIMTSVCFEALSKQKAERMAVYGSDRFMAEWAIPREEWEPLALAELNRMSSLAYGLDSGYLPERVAVDDEGRFTTLDPFGRDWRCAYCSFQSLCQKDGPGEIRLIDRSK